MTESNPNPHENSSLQDSEPLQQPRSDQRCAHSEDSLIDQQDYLDSLTRQDEHTQAEPQPLDIIYGPVKFAVHRTEPNFDRACDAARRQAIKLLQVDDCGNIKCIADSHRTTDYIHIRFVSLSLDITMGGDCVEYLFECSVIREKQWEG